MLVVQPAFKITVSGLPVCSHTCKALTSCLAWSGSPNTQELLVGYASEGISQTRCLLSRLGDGALGYQQMSTPSHGRPRGSPRKCRHGDPQGCLSGRHGPLRGGQELGSMLESGSSFFFLGGIPQLERLSSYIPLPERIPLKPKGRPCASPAHLPRTKGSGKRGQQVEEEAWVVRGKSPPSFCSPSQLGALGWGPQRLGRWGSKQSPGATLESPQPLPSSLGPRPTQGPQSIFTNCCHGWEGPLGKG